MGFYINKEFKNYIEENGLLDKAGHVIVALSGGADSVCLLELLKRLREEDAKGFELSAVHINHGIRKESDEEEVFV